MFKRKMQKRQKKFWARDWPVLGVGIGGRISQFSGLLGYLGYYLYIP
jgi:hypothetical protein